MVDSHTHIQLRKDTICYTGNSDFPPTGHDWMAPLSSSAITAGFELLRVRVDVTQLMLQIADKGVLQCVAVCCSVLQTKIAACRWCHWLVCCSVLQCVAVCCSVLRCVAVWCSVVQCVAVCCNVLHYVAVCCSVVQCGAVWCSVVQLVAVQCSVLRCVADKDYRLSPVALTGVLQCVAMCVEVCCQCV